MTPLGASGTVYIARGVKTKNIFAIKFIPGNSIARDFILTFFEVKTNDDQIINIINEIEIMKQSIECPFVVE
jgi:hypothetical protein